MDVLQHANQLGLSKLQLKCEGILIENLEPSVVLDVMRMAELMSDKLHDACVRYAAANWEKVKEVTKDITEDETKKIMNHKAKVLQKALELV